MGSDINLPDNWGPYSYPVSLSDDGNVLAITLHGEILGQSGSSVTTSKKGKLYVYRFQNGDWQEEFAVSPNEENRFGYSLSLSGDGKTIAVGAPKDNNSGTLSYHGSVYLYRYNDVSSAWEADGRLNGGGNYWEFGESVSLSDDGQHLTVGVPSYTYNNGGSHIGSGGAVRYYEYNTGIGSWGNGIRVTYGTVAREKVGSHVVMSGDGNSIAVQHQLSSSPWGRVEVLARDAGGNWSRKGPYLTGNAQDGNFGKTLDISDDGKVLAVGSPTAEVTGTTGYNGHVRVFSWQDGSNTWQQMGTDLGNAQNNGRMGTDIALARNGQELAIGVPNGNHYGGQVLTFNFANGGWVEDVPSTVSGDKASHNYIGRSLALSENGQRLAVAYSGENLVRVFDETASTPATALNIGLNRNSHGYVNGTNNDLPQKNTPRTIEFWVNMTGGDNWRDIFRYGTNRSNQSIDLIIGYGKLQLDHTFSSSSAIVESDNKISENTWHHLAVTYDGTTAIIYIDGVEVNSATVTNPLNTTGFDYRIGDPSNYLNGTIDEFRIWNYARTAAQIADNRNCEMRSDEEGLVAYFPFNQGFINKHNVSVTTLVDKTDPSGAKNGTLERFKLMGTTSNWVAGKVTPVACAETSCLAGTAVGIAPNDGTRGALLVRDAAHPSTVPYLNFGQQGSRPFINKSFDLINTSTIPLTIRQITSSDGRFQIIEEDAYVDLVIPPGEHFLFSVEFSSSSSGRKTALISVETNDCAGPFNFAVEARK